MRIQVLMPSFHNNFIDTYQLLSHDNDVEFLIAKKKFHRVPKGIHAKPIPRTIFNLLSPIALWKYMNADVVIIKHLNTPDSILQALVARLKHIPIIFYTQRIRHPNNLLYKLFFPLYIQLVKNQQAYSVVEESYKDLKKHFQKRAYYLPFCIDSSHIKKKEFKPKKTINILCVAAFHERKDILVLLEALKIINDTRITCTLVGNYNSNDDAYFKKIKHFIKKNNLKVTIHADMLKEKMPSFYEQADLFVLPSRNEPGSYSNLEAMAHGLAVVCSDDNATGVSYTKQNGMLFKMSNAKSLAKSLKWILFKGNDIDWNKLSALGNESKKQVEHEHSPAALKKKFAHILQCAQ